MTTERSRDDFPARYARSRRFSLGHARDVAVSRSGDRVCFLRSDGAEDPVNGLWAYEVEEGRERLLADPAHLDPAGELPPEERARRERARESGGGIVAYGADRDMETIAFAYEGALFVTEVSDGQATSRRLATPAGVFDPRPDPAGRLVAYCVAGTLRVQDLRNGDDRCVAGPLEASEAATHAQDVTWGVAEFVAAEEMGRDRGFWWSPDGAALAITRVDDSAVSQWFIADPVEPGRQPQRVRYPAAGSANADVSLWLTTPDGRGDARRVDWDRERYPYLARVRWASRGPLTLLVQSRDQRSARVLVVEPDSATTRVVLEERDELWTELVAGCPTWLPDGRLVTTVDDEDTRRLAVDAEPISPPDLQIRRVVDASGPDVLVVACTTPPSSGVATVNVDSGEVAWLVDAPGVHDAVARAGTVVVRSATPASTNPEIRVHRAGRTRGRLASRGRTPEPRVDVEMLELGPRALRAALLMPPGDAPCPVLLDPYGGPHAQRVITSPSAYLVPAWFASQGLAVLVVDGRGTPGRGPRWEKAVAGDLAGPVLEDQIDALRAAGGRESRLDLDRVGIRGWSFGGYLAALAVLRRPDVFHAAVAGAPVTDWLLYDTHYTERYLGHPDENPDAYDRTSLVAEVQRAEQAGRPQRPLLLVHGLGDDNVVAAHSLRLSRALFEAGRSHTFLPLSGVTHMTPQEVVAENLLRLQARFLREALGAPPGHATA